MSDIADKDALVWECGPHVNAWKGHDARCRQVPRAHSLTDCWCGEHRASTGGGS